MTTMMRSRHLLSTTFVGVLVLGAAACGTETPTNTTDMGQQADMTPAQPLIGKWESKGDDVAPLLKAFNFVSLTATFQADTYTVDAVDNKGMTTKFSGAWTAKASGVAGIWDITLKQSMPSVATSVGIYQIDTTPTPNRMKYEVIQTEPNIGATPPTAQAGFGSSKSAQGPLGNSNIQMFSRIN